MCQFYDQTLGNLRMSIDITMVTTIDRATPCRSSRTAVDMIELMYATRSVPTRSHVIRGTGQRSRTVSHRVPIESPARPGANSIH